jgi:SAM-dependent methyltransferase
MAIDRCLYCDGTAGEEILAREMMFGLRHSFVYRRCAGCGSLWLANPPDDMSSYYGDTYYSLTPNARGSAIPGAPQRTSLILRLPAPIVSRLAGKRGFPLFFLWLQGLGISVTSRIGDIGSGEGGLVLALARHGFKDVWGYDPLIEGDRDDGAAHLRRSGIEGIEGQFDVIMFNHSLEHVANPVASLLQANERLTQRGHILVRAPVAGSYADRHYGPDWVALDPPRHLSVPSQLGLARAAAAAGLEVVRVFFDSEPLQFWASEQYQRDIPLRAETGGCAPEMVRPLRRRARELNARGEGDTAGYVLRRPR